MNTLDYILIGIIAIAALRCWFKGIIGEVLSAAALVGGLLSGVFFYRQVGALLSQMMELGGFEPVVGFIVAFAVVFIVVKIIERSLRSVLENLNLDVLDRVFGLLFGAVEGVLISAIIVMVLYYQPLVDVTSLLDGSFIARTLIPIVAERIPVQEATALISYAVRATV
ncbi:MAG: CvpA family protein [Spirochaetales bacterium]|nr:CvpA family protein [Spirochaetales bacterium]